MYLKGLRRVMSVIVALKIFFRLKYDKFVDFVLDYIMESD